MNNNKMKNQFTVQEIANWQLKKQDEISLPSMQRGFVWKPKQIEDLWDSLFRGFPIGSFLMAQTNQINKYNNLNFQS
jgi:uncharacterized protein with ParB-like and HNH nuclease domain